MVRKTTLNNKVVTAVKHYKKKLLQNGIKGEFIVFGSYAKGSARPWSDIDLCVISPSFGKNRFGEQVRLMKLRDDQTLLIEPHPFSPHEFTDRWDPLAAEIRSYGIPVS